VPSGPAIILTCGVAYLLSLLVGPRGSLLRQLLPRKHLSA
jgi:zinc/manganese transport system permease protein